MSDTSTNTDPGPTSHTVFVKTFAALFGLGLLGVLSMVPVVISQLDMLPPEMADLPAALLVVISLASPAIMLAISVAVGTLLAHRVGLRSLVAERVRQGTPIWSRLRPHLPMAFVLGLIYMLVMVGLEYLIDPLQVIDQLKEVAGEANLFATLVIQLLVGLFYGGIVEELLVRWGMMSLFAWVGWRVVQRGQGTPRSGVIWASIVVSALLFGIGHLPAMASVAGMTPLIIFRTILLNALGGLLFGWLYWRRSLEVAMVAHAATHVGLFLVNSGLALTI